MNQTYCERVTPRGETARRLGKNFSRLEDKIYLPDSVYTSSGGWPGELRGAGHARAHSARAHERPRERVPARYAAAVQFAAERARLLRLHAERRALRAAAFGSQLDAARAERIRALGQGRRFVAGAAERIVENLYLPARGRYSRITASTPRCARSTDRRAVTPPTKRLTAGICRPTSAARICRLTGLTQYYELTGDSRVGELVDEMFDTFTKIDFVGAHMQTHASLTATRGILRYYNTTKRPELLEFAKAAVRTVCRLRDDAELLQLQLVRAPELDRALRDRRLVYGRARAAPADRRAGTTSGSRRTSCTTGCITPNARTAASAATPALRPRRSRTCPVRTVCTKRSGAARCAARRGLHMPRGAPVLDSGDGFTVCEISSGDYVHGDSKLEISGDFVHTGKAMFELYAPDGEENVLRVYIPDVYETPVFSLNGASRCRRGRRPRLLA